MKLRWALLCVILLPISSLAGVFNLTAHGDWNQSSVAPTRSIGLINSPLLPIPRLFHRTHRHTVEALRQPQSVAEVRTRRNLDSCLMLNPASVTRYYDDASVQSTMMRGVLPALKEHASSEVYQRVRSAWHRLLFDADLTQLFVLRADVFRYAAVWLEGGFWLDADAVCIDSLDDTLASPQVSAEVNAAARRSTGNADPFPVGCVWAWEGSVPSPDESSASSSPLNWAFGCVAQHPFLLDLLSEAAGRVNAWLPGAATVADPSFAARVPTATPGTPPTRRGGHVLVDVLHLTGPAVVEAALSQYAHAHGAATLSSSAGAAARTPTGGRSAGSGLGAVRRSVAKESPSNAGTWDRATVLLRSGTGGAGGPRRSASGAAQPEHLVSACPLTPPMDASSVLVLPYCFFRSRGCGHLLERFGDVVGFHHEFDTSWRQSFWHNYFDEAGAQSLRP